MHVQRCIHMYIYLFTWKSTRPSASKEPESVMGMSLLVAIVGQATTVPVGRGG